MFDMRTLSSYVAERRQALGLNQTELAERSGVPRTTVNRIETGITKLPDASIRRALSKGLGVCHLDILIAAGEITEEEATHKGAELREPGPIDELCAMLEQIDLSNDFNVRGIRSQLRFWADNAGITRDDGL